MSLDIQRCVYMVETVIKHVAESMKCLGLLSKLLAEILCGIGFLAFARLGCTLCVHARGGCTLCVHTRGGGSAVISSVVFRCFGDVFALGMFFGPAAREVAEHVVNFSDKPEREEEESETGVHGELQRVFGYGWLTLFALPGRKGGGAGFPVE